MSRENVKHFFIKAERDEAIKKNLLEALKGIKPEMQDEASQKIVQIARAAGFDFNIEELLEARAELIDTANANPELSDRDLGVVSGGINPSYKAMVVSVSVATVGAGCAVMSVIGEVSTNSSGCSSWLTTNKNYYECK